MDNIQVFMRIRPLSEDEYRRDRTTQSAVRILSEDTVSIPSQRTETFTFDYVGDQDCAQEQVFEAVGKRAVDQCMKGYNGTIFAYGQTGSGKTFTMQGARDEFTGPDDELRGLIPRCFEYLFARIAEEEARSNGRVKYLCRASYIEIYNETIYDLLDPLIRMCALREDIKRGVFIDNVTEETVQDPSEAYDVFLRGTMSRHVSATSMNRESSRSHSVLMLVIQSLTQMDTGMTEVRESKFSLVDLAGSERQKLANTSGLRLKEAANINKSLSTLGNVINSLVDVANGKSRHVNYRDSKLTFLLKDSLGGNSVTSIIANVSPAMCNDMETASTLRFAQRAKMIRNNAVVNQDMQGDVTQLQAEIQRLKQHIAHLQGSPGTVAATSGTVTAVPSMTGSLNGAPHDFGPDSSTLSGGTYPTNMYDAANKEHQTTQFLLILAMRKLRESERQKARYAEIIFELKDSLDRQKRRLQQQKLVLKLAKAENNTLRQGMSPAYASSAENSTLREEITELQEALAAQPDSSDILIENMLLHEELDSLMDKQQDQQSPSGGTGTPSPSSPPGQADAIAALENLMSTKSSSVDLQSKFPIIPDDSVYSGLESKIKQMKHEINDLGMQRDKLEFQIGSIDVDWQGVSDGARKLATATTTEQINEIIEHTMDGIVGDQARDTWSTISLLYTQTF
ncbi:Kinesin-like protein kif15 [Coemansia sp. RSA 1813]|nr:Kinesin-like protein kif15 [Coemansia sp. RSA 1646]KAJ1773698.1 Kinesin-like protein kif15 [Coemansia sp. RSA 1843]KAJ2093659.1 Kinesin-like protein kif15 [Coemansia sp. RSA 986]KAJ2217872.1 Kinesin-like protein kif15 [Coemansia sp. RSA 487]KAJ2573290.1 Kinesin-like protein kif15 [Coemansia sp. RSA 1813]